MRTETSDNALTIQYKSIKLLTAGACIYLSVWFDLSVGKTDIKIIYIFSSETYFYKHNCFSTQTAVDEIHHFARSSGLDRVLVGLGKWGEKKVSAFSCPVWSPLAP